MYAWIQRKDDQQQNTFAWYTFVKGCVTWLNEQTHTHKNICENTQKSIGMFQKQTWLVFPLYFIHVCLKIFLCILWKMCPSEEIYEADIFMGVKCLNGANSQQKGFLSTLSLFNVQHVILIYIWKQKLHYVTKLNYFFYSKMN